MPYAAPGLPAENSTDPDPSDVSQLGLLAILHYVWGGLGMICGCIPSIHVGMGVMLVLEPQALSGGSGEAPPPELGYFFIVVGLFAIATAWALSICAIVSGNYLKQQRRRMFSIIVAAVSCASFPIGTALGVFTIVVMMRPSVIRMYERNQGM